MHTFPRGLPVIFCILVACGCATNDNPASPAPPAGGRGVFILNEGNFQRNNSTLDYFLPDSGIVYHDVYGSANGVGLGDTGNDLTIHDGKLYIVVNGSNRIEIVDERTRVRIGTISMAPGASPRHIAFAQNGLGFITELYTSTVSVYDPSRGEIVRDVPVGPNPEQLIVAGDAVFVANSGLGSGNTVSVIDVASQTVTATLRVGDNPTAIAALNARTGIVLCTGAYNDFSTPDDDTPGRLFFIDLVEKRVLDSLELGGHPQRLTFDGANDIYTVHEDGITRIEPSTRAVNHRYIAGAFYSVAFDRIRNLLYVTEPLDFVQAGKLDVYSGSGMLLGSHTAGVIPGSMAIEE